MQLPVPHPNYTSGQGPEAKYLLEADSRACFGLFVVLFLFARFFSIALGKATITELFC